MTEQGEHDAADQGGQGRDPAPQHDGSAQPASQQDEGHSSDDDSKPKTKFSTRTKLILLAVALVALVAGGVWLIRYEAYGKFQQDTNDAYVKADMVAIAPRVNGYVDQVLVDDNQEVRVGQPLIRIDARDYHAQAEQYRAQMAQADAGAANARAQVRQQYAAIEQARAQLAAAQIKAAHDQTEAARYAPLASSGAESREQIAQLRATADQSLQTARGQAAALLAQQRQVAALETQIQQALAQRQSAQAQLDAANVNVNATLLRAPVDGRVGDKNVMIGQYASAGTRLMSVVPVTQLYVTANFKETQLALMRPGQPATISVDALDGTKLPGRVASMSPGTGAQFSVLPAQNATGNFTKIVQRVPVRVMIEATPDARRLLVPGMSVTVTVDTRGAKGQLKQVQMQQRRLMDHQP